MQSSSSDIGEEVAAGLPNITGGFANLLASGTTDTDTMGSAYVSFYTKYRNNDNVHAAMAGYRQTTGDTDGIGFDASRSSSVYGKSNTVQPPAIRAKVWERVA